MKRRSPVCLLTLAAALGIADRAAADHRDVEYQLRIQFDQRMADLESDFRIHREHLERSKRRAFAEIEIARQQARSMCEPQRTHALRALDSRRHELEIAYRSRMQQLQAQTEFSRNRLRFERDSELAQLRDKHRANYRPRTNYPMPGFSQPPLAPVVAYSRILQAMQNRYSGLMLKKPRLSNRQLNTGYGPCPTCKSHLDVWAF